MSRRSRVLARYVLPVYWAALAVGSHWPKLDISAELGIPNAALPFGLDKWLHFGGYAGLAILLLAAHLFRDRSIIKSLAIGLVYAAVDELTQYFSPGRTVTWSDWFASISGLSAGAITWWVIGILSREDESFVAHTRLVSALTLTSRVFGLLRDRALIWAFGFSGVMDAFVIALMAPNLFRRLFGEGALAAAFIPQYARLREENPASAQRLAARVIGLLTIGLVSLTAVGMLVLAILLLTGVLDARGDLAAKLTLVTLWYMPAVCIAAIVGAVLQVHRRFGVPAASPIVLNLFLIVSAVIAAALPFELLTLRGRVFIVAAALVAAGAVQLIWHWTAMSDCGVKLRMRGSGGDDYRHDDAARDGVRRLRAQWGPTVLGLAVFQINTLADVLIAMIFSGPADAAMNLFGADVSYPMRIGAPAVLGAAQRLYEFPLGVFGIAVATAIYPQLAAAARDSQRFADLLRQGLRLTIFIGLPASIGLLLVRDPLSKAIYYQGGRITVDDYQRVAWVLAGYAPAVWAYSLNHLLTRVFYAHENPITPMRIAVAMVGLNLVLNLTLIWLPIGEGERLGTAGLAWSTAICAMLQSLILLRAVRRYVQRPFDAAVGGSCARIALLSAIMGAAVWATMRVFDVAALGWWANVGVLAGVVALGAAIFAAGAWIVRLHELRWLLRGSMPKS